MERSSSCRDTRQPQWAEGKACAGWHLGLGLIVATGHSSFRIQPVFGNWNGSLLPKRKQRSQGLWSFHPSQRKTSPSEPTSELSLSRHQSRCLLDSCTAWVTTPWPLLSVNADHFLCLGHQAKEQANLTHTDGASQSREHVTEAARHIHASLRKGT